MAEARKPLEVGSNQLELLEFSIEEINKATGARYRGLYGINVYKVRHVIPMPQITPVPLQSECIEGVFHFRGENIPLVNLARYLGVTEAGEVGDKMVIIAEFNNLQVGFIARTPRGRVATAAGYQHMGLAAPTKAPSGGQGGAQGRLF